MLKNLQRMQLKLLQEKSQKIIDELRLVQENNNRISKYSISVGQRSCAKHIKSIV